MAGKARRSSKGKKLYAVRDKAGLLTFKNLSPCLHPLPIQSNFKQKGKGAYRQSTYKQSFVFSMTQLESRLIMLTK